MNNAHKLGTINTLLSEQQSLEIVDTGMYHWFGLRVALRMHHLELFCL